jgi:GalNAc5-diNAcBac-PP-undecaprenol beta-1,3-glucosyltransferase
MSEGVAHSPRPAAEAGQPLVSAIIITRNRPSLLLNAIQSVKNQRYGNIEIIVVDDCSEVDPTGIVAARHPDVRVLRNPTNGGPAYSRNRGIDDARGEIIAFLDDDDEWLPDKLDEQVRLLRETDACVCGYRVRETGKVRTQNVARVTRHHLRQGNLFCGGSGFAARRHVFGRIRFDETLWGCEDWDIYVQIVQNLTLGNTSKPLFVYRRGNQQSLSNQDHDDGAKPVVTKLACLEKNRTFLGEFYFGVRTAGTHLRFIGARAGRSRRILSTMRKAGVLPTLYYLYQKLAHRNGPSLSTP